mmetsp:Transcript_44054/g.133426  ORF Transcript_44054/g.133426 Transcript_44054/m.133426 type:complete len:505 (+) Transcript_44054:429-1943(+)
MLSDAVGDDDRVRIALHGPVAVLVLPLFPHRVPHVDEELGVARGPVLGHADPGLLEGVAPHGALQVVLADVLLVDLEQVEIIARENTEVLPHLLRLGQKRLHNLNLVDCVDHRHAIQRGARAARLLINDVPHLARPRLHVGRKIPLRLGSHRQRPSLLRRRSRPRPLRRIRQLAPFLGYDPLAAPAEVTIVLAASAAAGFPGVFLTVLYADGAAPIVVLPVGVLVALPRPPLLVFVGVPLGVLDYALVIRFGIRGALLGVLDYVTAIRLGVLGVLLGVLDFLARDHRRPAKIRDLLVGDQRVPLATQTSVSTVGSARAAALEEGVLEAALRPDGGAPQVVLPVLVVVALPRRGLLFPTFFDDDVVAHFGPGNAHVRRMPQAHSTGSIRHLPSHAVDRLIARPKLQPVSGGVVSVGHVDAQVRMRGPADEAVPPREGEVAVLLVVTPASNHAAAQGRRRRPHADGPMVGVLLQQALAPMQVGFPNLLIGNVDQHARALPVRGAKP